MNSFFISFIDCVKNDFSNAVISNCQEGRCKLNLDGLNNYVLLKGEIICTDRKICDCIIFTKDNLIIIGTIELKSKDIHASEIVEKLTNGSEIALDIINKCKVDYMKFEFYPLVLWKSIRTPEYKVITSKKIIVRGKKYNIIPQRCGCSFSTVISRFR